MTHQSALKQGAEQSKAQHEFQAKQDLISKAKAEWTKKNMPAQSKTSDGGGEFDSFFLFARVGWVELDLEWTTLSAIEDAIRALWLRSCAGYVQSAPWALKRRSREHELTVSSYILTQNTVISDPEDPKFDLEAWLTMQQAAS